MMDCIERKIIMETKALDNALAIVLNNDVLFASYGGAFKDAAAELAALKSELEIKQSLLDEAIRKGLQLCEQNGTLLMEAHAMKSRLAEAHAAINKILSVQDGTTDGDAFTTSEGCYSCDEKDEIARAFLADKQEKPK